MMKVRFNGRVVIFRCPVCGYVFSAVPQDCIRGLDGSYITYCPDCVKRARTTRCKVASDTTVDVQGQLLIESPESVTVRQIPGIQG